MVSQVFTPKKKKKNTFKSLKTAAGVHFFYFFISADVKITTTSKLE